MNPFLSADSAVRSLNRARIVALPGVQVDAGILGQNGYALLSAKTLHTEVATVASALGLDAGAPDFLPRFYRLLEVEPVSPLAMALVRRYGRRLGFLLLMLRRGDAANRAARPEWTEAHWAFWGGLERIILGGGLLSGKAGEIILAAVRAVLDENGAAGLVVERASHPAHLPLIGLARAAPAGATQMLALDFGQSAVKRGLALYQDGILVELRLLPASSTVCDSLTEPSLPDMVRQRWQQMLAVIATSWSQVPQGVAATTALGISLACYLLEGHPAPRDQGCYGALQMLTPHLETFMREQIAERVDVVPHLVLMHDGTAAATAYAGAANVVVLTLGTAIGNGFPPAGCAYRPVFPHFAVRR